MILRLRLNCAARGIVQAEAERRPVDRNGCIGRRSQCELMIAMGMLG